MRWFLDGEENAPPWRDTGENADSIAIFRPSGFVEATTGDPLISEKYKAENFGLGNPDYLRGAMDAGLSSTQAIKVALRTYVYAGYPLIEFGHFGPPVIWISETEQGDPEEFFDACGVNGAEMIYERHIAIAAE